MQTTSIMVQSLCVPCCNRCRYCLLSWDGKTEGSEWERSVRFAGRFLGEIRKQRPEASSYFTFGYSMEHPDLASALRTLRSLGSPSAEFLQCDGMKMRTEAECGRLMEMLCREGVRQLGFTVYGPEEYHDRFAGRKGDFALLLRMMRAAGGAGLPFRIGIPLTEENRAGMEGLLEILRDCGSEQISLFVPHEEGRGKALGKIRITRSGFLLLPPQIRGLLNTDIYRAEADWLKDAQPVRDSRRLILVSLRSGKTEEYETKDADTIVREIERLDEAYYAAFPDFPHLAERYGDFQGDRLYRIRDLAQHYRTLYAREHGLEIYDVTDERQSGSRRF